MSRYLVACLLFMTAPLAGANLAHDPTRPAALPAAGTPAASRPAVPWQLQSIVVRGESRRAVINGRSVRVGEQIGAATVRAIGAGSVVLETPEAVVELSMERPVVRQQANTIW